MPSKSAIVIVYAGPNGSGKSSVFKELGYIGQYVNADEIKKELKCSDIDAAEKAEAIREDLLNKQKDFCFETVLSTERNLIFLRRAKQVGYYIKGIFVLTKDPQVNVSRVKYRFLRGGHDVPEDKILSRYYKSLANLPAFIDLCEECVVFDNSLESSDLIFEKIGHTQKIYESTVWLKEEIQKLINGSK